MLFVQKHLVPTRSLLPRVLRHCGQLPRRNSTGGSHDGSQSHIDPRRVLLTSEEAAALPPLAARQRHVKVPLHDGTVRMLDVFVLRDADGHIRGYENYCPHAGGPLNMFPDSFFARDGQSLICTRHGAKFDPNDGSCFHGPCVGTALHPMEVEVDAATGSVCATLGELESVCDDGFGAFILCDAGSAEACGPDVVRPEPPPPRRPRARARRQSPKPNT